MPLIFFGYKTIAAVLGHTRSHHGGGIGHYADHGQVPTGHSLDFFHTEPCRHGNEQGLFFLQAFPDRGECRLHHLGLYGQKDPVAIPGNFLGASVSHAQLVRQSLASAAPVCEHDVLCHLTDGPGNGTAHTAAA